MSKVWAWCLILGHATLLHTMQSDGKSFCGNVVLDSFNMSYRDEDSILDQKYGNANFLGSLL